MNAPMNCVERDDGKQSRARSPRGGISRKDEVACAHTPDAMKDWSSFPY
jgi:hypothetical protein